MPSVVADLSAAIAARGLTGTRTVFPHQPLPPAAWRRLEAVAQVHRLTGLLADAVLDGDLPATDEQQARALERHLAAMDHVLRIERLLLEVSDLLDAQGIEHRVLKGSAHAHLLFADPSLRPFGDLDLLVPGPRFADAVATLAEAGIRRPLPELVAGFDRRFGKGATLVTRDGHEIDLHRTFVDGPFAMTIDTDALLANPEPFEVGGSTLLALGREERLVHACFHAAVSDARPRLLSLRDVANAALDPAIDVERVHALAEAWRGSAVVARAMRLTWSTLDLADETPLSAWSRAYVPTRVEERRLAAYTTVSDRWSKRAIAAVPAIPGVRGKVAYLRALAGPDARALRARNRSHLSFWLRGARTVMRSANRP